MDYDPVYYYTWEKAIDNLVDGDTARFFKEKELSDNLFGLITDRCKDDPGLKRMMAIAKARYEAFMERDNLRDFIESFIVGEDWMIANVAAEAKAAW